MRTASIASSPCRVANAAFNGLGFWGYSRLHESFETFWIDSLSTYMSVSRGPAADGVITLEMNDPDFMTGEKTKTKMTVAWNEEGQGVLTMLKPGPDGKDITTMRMTYTKKTE